VSHWDSAAQTIVSWPTHYHEYPGWIVVDCGCCAGIRWGGDSPRECDHCGGGGTICVHLGSRRIADWPGGPLRGQMHEDDLARAMASLQQEADVPSAP
jgi:hypothetical protein